jgi:carbonic anhydrase
MSHRRILENNRQWVAATLRDDPDFFSRLAAEHKPHYLFIGCSDARVPANVITQTKEGEMFVHRNIANMVVPTDNNMLAVLQYAVEALGVTDIFVCGHYGCGGVKAAMEDSLPLQFVDNWLTNIRTVRRLHAEELESIPDTEHRYQRLVELNVMEQVYNLSRTPVVQAAWARGAELRLHGWVYELGEGLLRDLGVNIDGTTTAADAAPDSGRIVVRAPETSEMPEMPEASAAPARRRAVDVVA